MPGRASIPAVLPVEAPEFAHFELFSAKVGSARTKSLLFRNRAQSLAIAHGWWLLGRGRG